jgi:hypothetical protein
MKFIAAFAFLFIVTISDGETGVITDGNSLAEGLRLFNRMEAHEKLTDTEMTSVGVTAAYIHGFLDACRTWQLFPERPFELPKEGLTDRQFMKMLEKTLNDHPDQLHKPAAAIVFVVLAGGFPQASQQRN